MKQFIYNNQLCNATELAMLLAFGKITNPYKQTDSEYELYNSIALAINELTEVK